ncbi:adenosine deaminase [Clavibacter michiganensis subsp. insidiosus]|uniref:Adenine deaminase n=1 Tax=Clavibacter michiganensis subsp. insidiosus TaxID=33014 RepID=A0A399N3G7_9MICO|nr:adenosine deaminase [Clavibacter michiganensis]AWG00528.1 adenosine deaminase [Clavibacter michiganensis subsp. insidiosus]OQJ60856.1 adenosine deaminase [Clavibacter michiganensis subsp. insidiosus]RII87729.1 adenosine deaminase [Clavibacter michiganensis subsp. insidiosus]RIJ44637.1 adenosine deaminase [Clavibacter michiganensis subsp. insidiosus]RMC84150.1 adenosine deaminase [Clavibacter michiganensis subsp. insidiosus]
MISTLPPTAELHLHVEGTLEPELVFELAERNGVDLPYAGIEDLRSRYAFTDLQSFLDLYYACTAVLRTRRDFHDLAAAYLERAAADGIRHVEMSFDPQAHTTRGVAVDDVLDGLLDALRDARVRHGISGGLILSFLRDRPVEEAMATLESVAGRAHELLAVGLDSAEVGYPPSLFVDVFARARELGLHAVAHAGEEGPPSYIHEALDLLRVERVDHGVRCLEDPALVDRLVADRIPLTVCPLSNVRLGVNETLDEHALPELLARGVLATVNSDDPAYFGGYLGENLRQLRRAHAFDDDALALLARNSFEASFLPDARRAELLAAVDAWRASAL